LALATEKEVKLSVFQNRRWDSDLKTVRQVLLDGVGDIVEAEFHFDRYNPF
jgi:predicted dehydrogenase